MATGGIFTIITNDGKQDRMLMATALLHERLRAINAFKQSQNGGSADSLANLPTLLDIEKTHVLFTNAHFKPFAAIGFEYNKVRPTSGNPALGSTIQFSIPQFGDFFHDVCGHVVLLQPTLNSTATTVSDAPLMRWCSFPGERLFQRVQQEVNGNPLDEYTYHAVNMHREYRVAPNKLTGWNRCVGQEEPLDNGFVLQPTWAFNNVAAASVTSRIGANIYNGVQTPSGQKTGNLELFIPLLFWYNKDVRLAVPSVAIPYGQRFINIDLAPLANLCDVYPRGAGTFAAPLGSLSESVPTLSSIELYINNIFVNPEVHKIYIKRVGFSLIRVHRQQLYNANSSSQEVLLQQLKWPIEYLFVGMKIKNYYAGDATNTRTNLDKWQLFSRVTNTSFASTGQNVEKLTNWLLATGTVAIAATTGIVTTAVANTAQALPQFGVIKVNGFNYTYTAATVAAGTAPGALGAVTPIPTAAVAATTNVFIVESQAMQYEAWVGANTVDNLTIKAHGINIYDNFPVKFYNAYTSYHYGGMNMNTPKDRGLCLIPFCLYPGTYQPSGHINVSRAREFYINYDSSVISSSVEGTLVVIASAINFLLISDGSAVLRYST